MKVDICTPLEMLAENVNCIETNGSGAERIKMVVLSNAISRPVVTVHDDQSCEVISVKECSFEEKAKRSKKFRVEWMEEVHFKDWLQPHPTDDTYCICVACDIKLRCGKSELEKHASGLKHSRRMEAMKDDPPVIEKSSTAQEKTQNELQPARIFCEENGASFIVTPSKSDESLKSIAASISENTNSDSTLCGTLLKLFEFADGKVNLSKRKLEMAENEHKCKMQILEKELQLKSLEVKLKEAELQKIQSLHSVDDSE